MSYFTKEIVVGSECPEAGVLDPDTLDYEIICNTSGCLENGIASMFYMDAPSGSGVIPCDPLPACRTVSVSVRNDSCPEHGVTYNPIVELTWSNPSTDSARGVTDIHIWRLHSQGAMDDGEGVTAEDWETFGRGNWQLIYSVAAGGAGTTQTFQDGSEGYNPGGTTGSWADYPLGKVVYTAGAVPSTYYTAANSSGQGYPLSTLLTTAVDENDPEEWWGLAKDCYSDDCLPHKYKYLVVARNECGSLLWTSSPALLDFYTGSNSIDANNDGSGDGQLLSSGITEWQHSQLVTEACGTGEVTIPCCNLVPCAEDQTFFMDCNLTSTDLTEPVTNYITFALDGTNTQGGGPTCFHTSSAVTLSPSNGSDTGSLYFSCPDATVAEPCSDGYYYPTGSTGSTGYGADGTDPHPCHNHASGSNASAFGIMTYIPPIGWSGSVTFDWLHETLCEFTASATVTIKVHCPTCIDEEKRYNICDATIEQLSAEHPKAAGVEQVPFSLYRKGPGSLRRHDGVATARLVWGAVDNDFPTDGQTIALSDGSTTITLQMTAGVTTADGSTNGSGNYIVGFGGLSTATSGNNYLGYQELSARIILVINAQTAADITASDPDGASGLRGVLLTQDTAGTNGNTAVTQNVDNLTAAGGYHGTTNKFDGGAPSGSAYVVTKGYDGLTVTGSSS